MRRLTTITITATALLLGLGTFALAQSDTLLDGKLRAGDRITIGGDEVIEGDLYVFGGDVGIDGRITGDLVVFGGQVGITGEVGGDLLVGAGVLNIGGEVDGDVRVGAGQLRVTGAVAEDVFAGVGRLDASGSIGGDLVFGAGQVLVPGSVAGDVLGSTGDYDRSGTVGGTETVTLEETADEPGPGPVTRALRQFGSLLTIGLIVMWLGRRRFDSAVRAVDERPGSVVLRGLIFLAGLVIAPLGVTVVGVLLALLFAWIGLGLLVGLSVLSIVITWVLVAAVAIFTITALAPVLAATWAASKVLPADTPGYGLLAVGLGGLVVLLLVPVIGPLLGLTVTIVGAGAWLATVAPARTPFDRPTVSGAPIG